MGIMEGILLIIGAALAIASFVIPVSQQEAAESDKELAAEEIKAIVDREMKDIRKHTDEVVGEAVDYAVEKTERSLERLTNEKMMAINEYSDTVLQEINKNHNEVMFLYDMLNDKHTNLKNTVSEATRTAQAVEETKKEAEAVVSGFQKISAPLAEEAPKPSEPVREEKEAVQHTAQAIPATEFNFGERESREENHNERILELFRQGKSKVAIAKELGLGVGEVKLVIDLYKNQ